MFYFFSHEASVPAMNWLKNILLSFKPVYPEFPFLYIIMRPSKWSSIWLWECLYQCCGSESGTAWIRIDFARLNRDPRGQQSPTKIKKVKKFHVTKCWMFSFGMKASPVALGPSWRLRDKKNCKFRFWKTRFFSAVNFLVIRIMEPDPHWSKMPDPDPHWSQCGSTTLVVLWACSLLSGSVPKSSL